MLFPNKMFQQMIFIIKVNLQPAEKLNNIAQKQPVAPSFTDPFKLQSNH